jgi:hypothetical protein
MQHLGRKCGVNGRGPPEIFIAEIKAPTQRLHFDLLELSYVDVTYKIQALTVMVFEEVEARTIQPSKTPETV